MKTRGTIWVRRLAFWTSVLGALIASVPPASTRSLSGQQVECPVRGLQLAAAGAP